MFKVLGVFLMMCAATVSQAHITAQSLEEVQLLLDDALETYAPEDILVVFDIDYTLLASPLPALAMQNIIQHRDIYKNILGALPGDKADFAITHAVLRASQNLIDLEMPALIQMLQQRGVRTLALTANTTHPLEEKQCPIQVKHRQLKEHGIDFACAFAHVESPMHFKDYPLFGKTVPMFFEGILASNGEKGEHTKGNVLIDFLNHAQYHPRLIIMLDDRAQNLHDVAKALTDFDQQLTFQEIEYQKGHQLPAVPISAEKFKEFWQNQAKIASALLA